MKENMIYQVSTLQALSLGYTKTVVTVEELLKHGDTGLGTFEAVNGEMILADGHCYRAMEQGAVEEVKAEEGVPFSSVTFLSGDRTGHFGPVSDIELLKQKLDLLIEERFGLNSMHVVRIDGDFAQICARSESPFRSQHVELKEILSKTQKDFKFENIRGIMVCIYYPDYLAGINAPGWHLHFVSEDRKQGGHVFDLSMKSGSWRLDKINKIEMQLPNDPAFDTYALQEASQSDIKKVEQGKK